MACELYALGERHYTSLLAFPERDKVCSYGPCQWRGDLRSHLVSNAGYYQHLILQRCIPCLQMGLLCLSVPINCSAGVLQAPRDRVDCRALFCCLLQRMGKPVWHTRLSNSLQDLKNKMTTTKPTKQKHKKATFPLISKLASLLCHGIVRNS